MARPANKGTAEILYGKCRWAKLFSPSQYNKWSLELNLDPDSVTKVLELKRRGIRNVLKKDDEGYWITLSRNVTYKYLNQDKPNTPPVVLDKEGQPWNKDKGIGNGSDVAVKVIVKEYKVPGTIDGKGIAVRLDSVKVLNLVPFDMNKDFEDDERDQVKGLDTAESKPW